MSSSLKFVLDMIRHGVTPPKKIIRDGKLHACDVEGHPIGSKNGWYIFAIGRPNIGFYGCFETKLSRIWASKAYDAMNKEEKIVYHNMVVAMRKARAIERKRYMAKTKPVTDALATDTESIITKEVSIINDDEQLEIGINKDNVNKLVKEQIKRVCPPDVTGRKGAIKTMVLGGLQAFYNEYKRLPEEGNAFQVFLDFIYYQLNQKTKPDYLALIDKVIKTGTATSNCVKIIGAKKSRSRKYISTQFYTFKKNFSPQVTTEEPAHP